MHSNYHSVDFYVGTAPNAIWIGTLNGSEGEPPCMIENTTFGRGLLEATDVVTYRNAVTALFQETHDDSLGWTSTPDDGWPWPEPTSIRTDWVIQFHHGRAWITVGYPISPARAAEASGPVATTDHTAANVPHSAATDDSETDPQADQRGMLFALLRDAVDAVTKGNYPGSAVEEVIDDLRDAFDAYTALADNAQPENSAYSANSAHQPS